MALAALKTASCRWPAAWCSSARRCRPRCGSRPSRIGCARAQIYRRDQVGWAGLPEAIRRRNPDLNVADVLRIQHMMGPSRACPARVISGVPVDRDLFAEEMPTLVIGGGLDHEFP
jgi:hypothetical protein